MCVPVASNDHVPARKTKSGSFTDIFAFSDSVHFELSCRFLYFYTGLHETLQISH